MIEPKEMEVNGKTFILSKFPAVAGREIITKYPVSNMPKLGDYQQSEETMLKLMCYVAVKLDETGTLPPIRLSTAALVDNHAGDWETLAKLEYAMLEYNCSFFGNGRSLDLFEAIARKLMPLISQTLTGLSDRLSQADKPPSMN